MKQINKTAAKKLYAKGGEFWITACNMQPEQGLLIKNNGDSFETLYNNFCYYNCDNERGRYPRFYVEEEE